MEAVRITISNVYRTGHNNPRPVFDMYGNLNVSHRQEKIFLTISDLIRDRAVISNFNAQDPDVVVICVFKIKLYKVVDQRSSGEGHL